MTKNKKDKKDKDKKKWKLKNVTGEQWQQAGKAISGTAKKLSDTQDSEKSKTQALKDKLRIRKSQRK